MSDLSLNKNDESLQLLFDMVASEDLIASGQDFINSIPETNIVTYQGPLEQEPIENQKIDKKTNEKIITRKRKRYEHDWKRNIRRKQHQAGKHYINSRGDFVPSKEIVYKKDCTQYCKFKCFNKVTGFERQELFNSFYSLDQIEKNNYILKTTRRSEVGRKTKTDAVSRRKFSFQYFVELQEEMIQVCKSFWMGTFSISQKPVYNVHQFKNKLTGITKRDDRGKKSTKKIHQDKIDEVISQINSFPAIESHYCRANTNKKYLGSNLSVAKMYNLYKETVKDPVKLSFYRNIFCNNFNIDFHFPKSDRCGKCEAFSVSEKEGLLTEDSMEQKNNHMKLKYEMRDQKNSDKKSSVPVLCFDLENVLTCPRAEIGPLFYYCKLNIYNLTAHLSTTKKVYCAIWTECTGGRSGNDIASALYKILTRVFEDNDIKELITWSDSCVPQNRNSIMSFAIQLFLKNNPGIETITMKYSIAGHGAVQEVDNVHSQIEKCLSVNEYFSPMVLIRLLKNVNKKNPFTIIQMQPSDFKNFSNYTKEYFNYASIPFASLQMIKFKQNNFYEIDFSFDYQNMHKALIRRQPKLRLKKKKQKIFQICKKSKLFH